MEHEEELTVNPFASATSEDYIDKLVADNPAALQRKSAAGLILWVGWLLVVLTVIVWLVG